MNSSVKSFVGRKTEETTMSPREGYNKRHDFETTDGCGPSIQVNVLNSLTDERLIVALKRLRAIVKETTLSGYDERMCGMKSTECTWGLCLEDARLWPDAKDHKWPYDFLNSGRTSPLNHQRMKCPMQTEKGNGSGCFWYCKFFQKKLKSPTRQEYLSMIDEKIAELEADK